MKTTIQKKTVYASSRSWLGLKDCNRYFERFRRVLWTLPQAFAAGAGVREIDAALGVRGKKNRPRVEGGFPTKNIIYKLL